MDHDVPNLIRAHTGREMIIEAIVEACVYRGGFDEYLDTATLDSMTVARGKYGHADIEVRNGSGVAPLGIEVKISSNINSARYGGDEYITQLNKMIQFVEQLVIITSAARAKREKWPETAVILTLEDLARIAENVHLTVEDILAVELGMVA